MSSSKSSSRSSSKSSPASALRLFDLAQSHRITAVIYVAARLGIAELLRDRPRPLDELANATGVDRPALGRLLRALATIGICAPMEDDRYSLTETGAALDGVAEHSFKAWVIFEGEMLYKSWSGMLETIRTGQTAAQLLGLSDTFDLMSRTPANIQLFNAAMTDLTRFVTTGILAAYDFGGMSHLMDVGGGSGELMGAVAKQYPRLRGTVFDLPRCAEAANAHLEHLGIADRVSFVAGDFFRDVPAGADAIILKSVIHDWDDARSGTILRNCRRALPENGRLLLVERLLPSLPTVSDEGREHAMSNLNMLRGPGGIERTEAEYRALLAETGFSLQSIHPAGRFNVIEARVG